MKFRMEKEVVCLDAGLIIISRRSPVARSLRGLGMTSTVVAEACDHSRDDDNNSAQPLLVLPLSV